MPEPAKVDIFLCHNSKDKREIRQVADVLELEFGVNHFLDTFAIPAGEAFLPWIEKVLSDSRGCAIFLGENGWGPTHLREAEIALERYRREPTFRLLPVALPGIRDADMHRLGAGTLFSEINWIDLRSNIIDRESIAKFKSALLGEPAPVGIGPSHLTPYQVRREANRWRESGERDASILFRGRQLREAERLANEQSDLMAAAAIAPFLLASARRQRRRAWIVSIAAVVVAVALGGLTVMTENRRLLALSRYLANESQKSASPDLGLLIAVHAANTAPTPEAYGAIVDRLNAAPYLRRIVRNGDASIASLAFDPARKYLLVGTVGGEVRAYDLPDLTKFRVLPRPSTGAIRALLASKGMKRIWAALEDGRVVYYDGASSWASVPDVPTGFKQVTPGAVNAVRLGRPVIALALDEGERHLVASDDQGRVWIIDATTQTVQRSWRQDSRATSFAFVPGMAVLAIGSDGGRIEFRDIESETLLDAVTVARSGGVRSLGIADNGTMRVLDSGARVTIWQRNTPQPGFDLDWRKRMGEYVVNGERSFDAIVSSGATGPRITPAPIVGRHQFIIGSSNGSITLTPLRPHAEKPIVVPAHARTVSAAALSDDGLMAASGAYDGSVALWDLFNRSQLVTFIPPPAGEIIALRHNAVGHLVAVTTSDNTATVQRRDDTGWKITVDLVAVTKTVLGEEAFRVELPPPDKEGFREIGEKMVVSAALSAGGERVVWTTRRGAMLTLGINRAPGDARVVDQGTSVVRELSVSDDAHIAVIVRDDASGAILDLADPGRKPIVFKPSAGVRQAVVDAPGHYVAFALDDGKIVQFDLIDSTAPPRTLRTAGTAVQTLMFLPHSNRLLAAGAGGGAALTVEVLSLKPNEPPIRLNTRRIGGAITSFSANAAARLLAAGDHEGRIHLWDLDSLAPMGVIEVGERALGSLTFANDGKTLTASELSGDVSRITAKRELWPWIACLVTGGDIAMKGEWQSVIADERPKSVCENWRVVESNPRRTAGRERAQ